MRVLMLGWEFPPFISGGLGTACYGLTKGMSEIGTEVLFVLPRPVEASFATHVTLLTPLGAGSSMYRIEGFKNILFRTVDAGFGVSAYQVAAALAASTAARTSASEASATSPDCTPVAGLNTGAVRPLVPETFRPAMK